MKQRHFIDSHKGATGLFILGCMAGFDAWDNTTIWLYLATHGLYGLLWIHKSRSFGDKQWEQPCGIGYGAYIWAGLSLYWLTPYLICSQQVEAPPWLLALGVASFGLGVFYHFASDLQKHTALLNGPGLITTGLWSKLRNPNYFGELLIYMGFGMLAYTWAWVPALVLCVFIGVIWIPNMLKKDRSLSRYPEFEDYKKRSSWFIPFIL